MKNIKINVSLKNKDSLKKEIESLLSTKSFEIDTTAFTKSISAMSKELNKLKSQLSGFNILDGSNTNNITQTTQAVDKLTNSMSKIDKIKFNLQNKLNTAMSNELVNTSVIDNLQQKLNSLNSDTAEREVLELKTAINNLGSGDSGIVRVQQAIITLEQRIASIKSKNGIDIINQSEIAELQQAESEVSKLKTMLGQLTSGDVIDGKRISSSINTATNSVRTFESSLRSVNTSASGLSTTIRSIFSYALGGSGIYLFINSLKDTFNNIVELDSAMRDLKRVTSETEETYSSFMTTANETAKTLGTTTTEAIEATTRFSQLGYSFSQASEELSEYALVLSNVANMSATDSSSAIVSVLKGFQLETEDVSRIVDVINESGNKFAIDSGGLADALKVGSANLSIAGNDLEQASAMIITANEVMQDPTTVANGLKTISMRLRGVSEDGEELSATMNDLIVDMTGVAVEDTNGELRSTYDILNDIGKVWDTLSTKQQALLSEEIAGKNRANVFSSLMQNSEQLENAYNTLSDSAGSSTTEQEAYMDSLEGKINALKESVVGLSIQMTDSNILKGFIDGLTSGVGVIGSFIDTFGALPTAITAVVGSMTLLNTKFRENSTIQLGLLIPGYSKITTALKVFETTLTSSRASQIKNIDASRVLASGMQGGAVSTAGFGLELLKMQGKLALTTAGLIATKVATVALQTALSVGISLAISSLISGLSKLIDTFIKTEAEWSEVVDTATTNINTNNELIDSVKKLLSKEEELNNKMKDSNTTTEEQQQARTDLLEVQKQIAELLPESATGFDAEGNKISENTEKVLENLDAKQKLSEAEAISMIGSVNLYDSNVASKQYETEKQRYEDLLEAYKNGEQYKGVDVSEKMIEKSKKKVEAYKEDIETNMQIIEALRNSGWTDEQIANKLYSTTTLEDGLGIIERTESAYESMTQAINENTSAKDENGDSGVSDVDTSSSQDSVSNLESVYKSLGYTVDEASTRIEELNALSSEDQSAEIVKDATTAYGEAIDKTEEYTEMLNEINELSSMTPEMISELASKYPELGTSITDVASVQEFLNNKISESVQAQVDAYTQMVANDSTYYNSKIKNNQTLAESVNQLASQFVDSQGNAYSIDLDNYSTLAELKSQLTNDLGEGVAEFITNFVSGQAQGYDVDLNKKMFLISVMI